MPASLNETFPALDEHRAWLRHGFTLRVPGLDTNAGRTEVLARLQGVHFDILAAGGVAGPEKILLVEQVHGAAVAIEREGKINPSGADAIAAQTSGVAIGIYVADCGPVWVIDPVRRAVGLAHSGRKGTELGVVPALIHAMREAFGSRPGEMEAFLGPCIRPPDYETDFAAEILDQCRRAGLRRVSDCGANTASDPARYYSYRREKGRTGRMLAWAFLREQGDANGVVAPGKKPCSPPAD